jgi:uncharacterized protein YbjT (DUF2867 family)
MNSPRPTIAVCGATGQQGGAVLDHLEAQDRWHLRALSRNPDGEAGRRIRNHGIEVVRADLDDVDSLRAAFTGGPFLPVKRGALTGQADGDAKIPYVACTDIGAFAALAFADPERFVDRKLNLLGDFTSGDNLAATLTRVGGRPVRHKVPPVWLMRIFAREWITLRRMFEGWGRPPHPQVMLDALAECRSLRPDMLDFERYVRTTGWAPST